MVNESKRDTQFAGFATLLWQEIRDMQRRQINSLSDGLIHSSAEWDEEAMQIIARRAYDLVEHTLEVSEYEQPVSAVLPYVPDLTQWQEASRE